MGRARGRRMDDTLPAPKERQSEPPVGELGLVRWSVERPRRERALGAEPGYPEGTLIGHKFVVGAMLGRGGSSQVFRAHGHTIGRPVAMKIQTRAASEDQDLRSRFLRESRLLAALDHPSVVRVYEVGLLPDGTLACALELLDGLTLRETLARDGRLPPARAIDIAVQLLSALAAIHEHRIVHRDVKPGNVMLVQGRKGLRVKLIDFGAAKYVGKNALENITLPADIVGTPGYLAPEQITAGTPIGPATDLFALGVVLFEMLVGEKPFGTSSASLVRGLSRGSAQLRLALAELVSPELSELVSRLLSSDPKDRPASAKDALAQISSVPEASDADPEPARSSRPPQVRRNYVLVVSSSPIRRTMWARAAANLGAVPIPLAHVEAALLLLAHGDEGSGSTVMVDLSGLGSGEEDHLRALTSLDATRLRRVIHVVRETRSFWPASDARVRSLPMPVTEADLAPWISDFDQDSPVQGTRETDSP
jgi:serine/threonine protein kinase